MSASLATIKLTKTPKEAVLRVLITVGVVMKRDVMDVTTFRNLLVVSVNAI